jgi:hypothetical protein
VLAWFGPEKLKGKDHLEVLGVVRRVWFLNEWDGCVWTGFIRLVSNAGVFSSRLATRGLRRYRSDCMAYVLICGIYVD